MKITDKDTAVAELTAEARHGFNSLIKIMALLRSENGCPWDKEQTHESIRNNFIEETYEVVEAIDNGDKKLLCEELGDVMLQVVFHAQMEDETGTFDIDDVLDGICAKLITRHPHIFGDIKADTSDEVLKNWEAIKSEEKQRVTVTEKMHSVPPSLPALMRADKIGGKAAKAGFDFKDANDALDKIYEEADEIRMAMTEDPERLTEEVGDLLFSAVNVARLAGVEPETALNKSTAKFIDRFERVETAVAETGADMKTLGMKKLDAIWDMSKAHGMSKATDMSFAHGMNKAADVKK